MTTPNRRADSSSPMPAPSPPRPSIPTCSWREAALPTEDLPTVSARYIWFMVLAQFGVFMAFITPIAISLAVGSGELAPDNQEYLGLHHRRRRPVRDADRPVHGHLERPHPHPASAAVGRS